jgi:hypothetical protein
MLNIVRRATWIGLDAQIGTVLDRTISESSSGIQDGVPSTLKKFYDLLGFVRIDPHFFQSFAKVIKK